MIFLVCLLALALSSCTLSLPVDERLEVACQSDIECPTDSFCNAIIGRCVATERSDEIAPSVVSSSIEPRLVGPGGLVIVSLSTDESLRDPPTVSLFGQTSSGQSVSDSIFRVEIAIPETGVSETVSVRVTLVDELRNVTQALIGEFTTDFDPPTVAGFAWEDPAAAAIDSVVSFGGTSEADAAVTAARVVDGAGASVGLPELSATLDESGASAFLALRGLVRVSDLQNEIDAFAVEVDLVDPLGNMSTVRSPFKALDRAEPDTRIDTMPPLESTRLRASFTFSSPDDDVASYECSVDGGDFLPCSSPYEERVTTEGNHSFAVRAIDDTGFIDPTPAAYSWNETRVWAGAGTFSSDCAIASDGTLWCWDALTGGVEFVIDQTKPVQVGDEADWLAVVSGNGNGGNHLSGPRSEDNVCGIREDQGRNSVWCWGQGLGVGGQVGSAFPVRALEDGFASLSLTSLTACGIKLDGSLWCWGYGAAGQLGNGSFENRDAMVRVGDANDWTHVSVAGQATCGIRQEGVERNAYCWGINTAGAPGVGEDVRQSQPQRVGTDTDWIDIAPAGLATCGIRADGGMNTLWCYGELASSAVGEVPTRVGGETGWLQVQASGAAFCGLRDDGTLWCWGRTGMGFADYGQAINSPVPIRLSLDNEWLDFHLNTRSSELCAFDSRGELHCRGGSVAAFSFDLGGGDLGFSPVAGDIRWASLSVPNHLDNNGFGQNTICGIDADTQQAYCWGDSDDGGFRQPFDTLLVPTALDAGEWLSVRLERSRGPFATNGCGIVDGQLRCWGVVFDPAYVYDDPLIQLEPSDDWLSLSSGNELGFGELPNFCATRASANGPTLWCWGENRSGKLGQGDAIDRMNPTQVGATTSYEFGWDQLSQSQRTVCGIRVQDTERQLYCWGDGTGGRLGNGGNGDAFLPTRVGLNTDWLMVSATTHSTCGLRGNPGNAELWCWGLGDSGQLGDGLLQDYNVPTKIGDFDDWVSIGSVPGRRCGTRADGTLWCWGDNSGGHPVPSDPRARLPEPAQVGVPGGPIDLFVVGHSHACAQSDRLYCWGDSSKGLLGFPRLFGPVISTTPPRQ
ncbi:MAG: hypothetical protein AAF654_13810 [Myxococcota bacterium]